MNAIGWCSDQICQKNPIREQWVARATSRVQPVEDIPVLLGAIAGSAGGHDIPWFRLPTLGHRLDVVPGFPRCSAVGAPAVKLLQKHFSAIRRYWLYVAAILRRALCPTVSKSMQVRSIALPSVGIVARSALASSDRLVREPHAATAAPCQSCFTSGDPFVLCGARRCAAGITITTACLFAISARGVARKVRKWAPFVALRAALQPVRQTMLVLRQVKPSMGSCNLEGTQFCQGHAASFGAWLHQPIIAGGVDV